MHTSSGIGLLYQLLRHLDEQSERYQQQQQQQQEREKLV